MSRNPGQAEISFEYRRHLGPRIIHGAVTLSFDASRPYAFISTASWPEAENYEAAIREAIEGVLVQHQGGLETTQVTLVSITWDGISSCQRGFVQAAKAATYAAFETNS